MSIVIGLDVVVVGRRIVVGLNALLLVIGMFACCTVHKSIVGSLLCSLPLDHLPCCCLSPSAAYGPRTVFLVRPAIVFPRGVPFFRWDCVGFLDILVARKTQNLCQIPSMAPCGTGAQI